MWRRKFISLLGGSAATWPLTAGAQQSERMRRIGVLMSLTPDDPDGRARSDAFLQGLQRSGWIDGRNIRIDHRWGEAMPTTFASMQRNWSRSAQTPFWPLAR